MSNRLSPVGLLAAGVSSWMPHVQPDGDVHDPVFHTATQYGTAYLGWSSTVLAGQPAVAGGPDLTDRAIRLLETTLAHTADPSLEPHASGFDRRTQSITVRMNHRDFTWPPILKMARALDSGPHVQELIAGVNVEASFRTRPPKNWAAVWMSGEWRRMRAGLSPTSPEQFDEWLDVFFAGGEVGFDLDLDLGLYVEHGIPNAYDLFTRLHLTDLLLEGFDGRKP